jgi:hypothetical protein
MLKKSLSVFGVLVIGVLGFLVFCDDNNPAGTQPTDINGSWYGMTMEQKGGASLPDTFVCALKIENAGTYSLLRGRLCHGSSGATTDSAKETGSVTKIGTDSVVLSPAGGTCFYWDPGYGTWLKIDTTANSMFRTCPDPMHIKIDLSGTTWNATIPRFDDVTSVTYALKKQ